jgi:hypothetical protein
MKSLGFRLDYYENYGPFHHSRTPWIENEGFIFVRDEPRVKPPLEQERQTAADALA